MNMYLGKWIFLYNNERSEKIKMVKRKSYTLTRCTANLLTKGESGRVSA